MAGTCNPSYLGGWGRRITWTQEAEVVESQDYSIALQLRWQSGTPSPPKKLRYGSVYLFVVLSSLWDLWGQGLVSLFIAVAPVSQNLEQCLQNRQSSRHTGWINKLNTFWEKKKILFNSKIIYVLENTAYKIQKIELRTFISISIIKSWFSIAVSQHLLRACRYINGI